jgi:hypothetical protein
MMVARQFIAWNARKKEPVPLGNGMIPLVDRVFDLR